MQRHGLAGLLRIMALTDRDEACRSGPDDRARIGKPTVGFEPTTPALRGMGAA